MKKYNYLFFISWLLIAGTGLKAQDTLVLPEKNRWDSIIDMNQYVAFYEDLTGNLSPKEAWQQQFVADTNYREHLTKKFKAKKITLWMRWIIKNPLPQNENVLLLYHRSGFLKFYIETKEGIKEIKDTYHFFTTQTEFERRKVIIEVPKGATVTVVAKMIEPYFNFAQGYPLIIRESEYGPAIEEVAYQNRYIIFFDIFFLSVILFIVLHSLALYFFNNKSKEYLFYAFYAFCVFNYFLLKIDDYLYVDLFYSYLPLFPKYGNNPFSYLMFFGYYRFVRSFIDFKAIAPWFFKLILFTEKLLLSAMVMDLVLNKIYFPGARQWMFNSIRVYLIIMAFIGIYLLIRSRKKTSYFIAVGSGLLIIGSLLAMIFSWIKDPALPGHPDPIMFMQVGVILELICFTMGLSYKTSLIEKEKIATQQLLIDKLEENKVLQNELNVKLESRVQEQTSHILEQQQEIEKEKERQLTLEFQKKLTEMELQLLKSQLNPHFYFNTLNNLYGLSMISPVKAPDAILKLSDIMEYVIYDCKSEKVPLIKELKFISSYIDLEKLRYDKEDTIQLKIDVNSEGYEISPLLLIQFIENAFKHGMEEAKAGSFLNIEIHLADGWLYYTSENSINNREYSKGGVGLENVRKRLEMLYDGRHALDINQTDSTYQVKLSIQL